MEKILLRQITICDRRHWMTPNADDEVIIATKQIEVPSVADVRFTHTEVDLGCFSDTVQTYDAVRYGDEIYRLQYDLKADHWVGEKTKRSPRQSLHFTDYGKLVREAMQRNRSDWAVSIESR